MAPSWANALILCAIESINRKSKTVVKVNNFREIFTNKIKHLCSNLEMNYFFVLNPMKHTFMQAIHPATVHH